MATSLPRFPLSSFPNLFVSCLSLFVSADSDYLLPYLFILILAHAYYEWTLFRTESCLPAFVCALLSIHHSLILLLV